MTEYKILVIDDEEDICLLLSRYLSKKGYQVDTAKNGKEGIEKLSSELHHLVICDFRLPDIDGVEVLKK